MPTIEQELINLEIRLKAEIDTLREEKNRLIEDLNNQTEQLAMVKLALEKSIADETSTRVKEIEAANTAIQGAISSSTKLKSDIKNGNIIAQKAVMLQARNNKHWMKFKETVHGNDDFFSLIRTTDGKWFNNIKVSTSINSDGVAKLRSELKGGRIIVEKAVMLQARNDKHWMKYKETSNGKDFFSMFRIDGSWHDRIKV